MRYSALVLALTTLAGAPATARPVVVELFTSQGCSSCPPAEQVLLDLTRKRDDLLALGFHVDYWDRLGWKDPYSSREATSRQQSYQALIRSNGVYTPQMVVDGRADVLGSDKAAVEAAIADASRSPPDGPTLALRRDANGMSITIGAGSGRGRIWLVGYDRLRETPIRRGENAGRTVLQANIVRSFQPAGEWSGTAINLSRPLPAGESAAILLQAPDGRMLNVATLSP